MHKEGTQSTWIDFATLVVVAVFCFFSAKSVWVTPKPVPPNISLKNERIEDNLPRRAPASISNIQDTTQTERIGCLDKSRSKLYLESNANFLSLVLEICEKKQNPVQARFRNETTQDEILALYDPASFTVKTSYFPLRSGQNWISFELMNKKGMIVRQSLEIIKNSKNR